MIELSDEPQGDLLLRTMAMPADTNPNGDIFGGWILSQMDIAGSILAKEIANGRTVTIAVDGMKFIQPVSVGDVVCCYGALVRIGTTSLTLQLEVWVKPVLRELEDNQTRFKVTEAAFTYVAIDDQGRKRPVPKPEMRESSIAVATSGGTLSRVLEPEVMDSEQEASDYDQMDHSIVNAAFVDDLLAVGFEEGDTLDLGTGTAQIPIELCRRTEESVVLAVDLAVSMLDLAKYNVAASGFEHRIILEQIDSKSLPFEESTFDTVMSNSIIHHIPNPIDALREAVRVAKPGGLLFFRDLMRPADDATVRTLVSTYAGNENEHQRQMFDDSLRAALSLQEIGDLVKQLGFTADTVQATSDRHWTWAARKASA